MCEICGDFAPAWASVYQHLTEGLLTSGCGTLSLLLPSLSYALSSNRQIAHLVHHVGQLLAPHEVEGAAMKINNIHGEDALGQVAIDVWEW